MIDAQTIAVVVDVLRPEGAELVALLGSLDAEGWARPTECPAYTVQGVATHVLGDDLSLLSRQRDSPWYWGQMVGANKAQATSMGCASVWLAGPPFAGPVNCQYLTA